ncbi:MAG: class I SAM-dependent methyltransferase [Rhodospirillaceae bacterium]|nr:class I SAM-dependent methyltransferase [Rhodospirillaceae bacterium]MBT5373851.1 class I SAM-dependent methyltransferase [Rhodospirillaceae bacterium]
MGEVNLLHRYPRAKRNVAARHVEQKQNSQIARSFGKEYFDGAREQGYGGYKYDGRWVPIAEDIIAHWGLKPGDRVLDIGCAKGFLVKDLMTVCPGLEVFGVDISDYAVRNCEPEVVGRLHVGSCENMPFPDNSFDAAISINAIHNLDHEGCVRALREMARVSSKNNYIQVDSYRTEEEKENMEKWILTAVTAYDPDGWRRLFSEAGYDGDYYWTITE